MSDVKLWDISIALPTTCTASFQETSANIGDIIHADFTWENALKKVGEFHYAYMAIIDPSGVAQKNYFEFQYDTGSKTLDYVVDAAGTWTCEIKVWQGFMFIYATDDMISYGVMATLMATSSYYSKDPDTDRPFIPTTVATVCSLDIMNSGNMTGKLMWQIYSFAPDEKLEDEGTSIEDWASGTTWTKPIQLTIPEYPDEISMQLGVKVKGPLETWPTWPEGLALGNAKIITLENGTPMWFVPAAVVVVTVGGLLGAAYYMSKH